jgi:thiosulfate reductase/polysulfide reductase chain A
MQQEAFLSPLNESVQGCGFVDLATGAQVMTTYLQNRTAERAYQELRFDYAELFLNAGPSPVFPYESVHTSGEPVVMQKNVFEFREFYRKAGVHLSPSFQDLDEHVAVQMEFLRYLLEKGDVSSYESFFTTRYMKWVVSLCADLAAAATTDFYQGLALFTRGAIMCENMRLEGYTKGEETTKIMTTAVASLNLDPGYATLDKGSVEPEPEKEIATHCYTCGALCGMKARVKDGVLTGTTGLPGDPKGDGKLCPKGGSAVKHLYSPYRLKTPLIKEEGRFRKASWDEALDKVARGIQNIEPDKLAYFRGNDFVNWIHEALFDHLGCPKGTHRPMCDNSNRMATEHILNDKRPWINYQEADYILHFGMNELATSYGQRKTAELKRALKQGAKLVVFDPRQSETAKEAHEWIPIKPATDGAVAMAMAYVILSESLYDQDFVTNWTYGFEAFQRRVLGQEDGLARTPQWAAAISHVPAETIVRIAREFASSEHKGCLSWAGLAQVPNGMYATAAIQALNGLCGTFDAPGGPSLPFKRKLKSAWAPDQKKPPKTDSPKIDSFAMWSGWAPAHILADVRAGKIKGLISYYGDPVLSWGNQEATIQAINEMDFKVSIEAFMSNTALLCDVILPDATWLEQSFVKPEWLYEATILYFAQVVKPLYNSKPIWEIIAKLAKRLGLGEYFPWDTIEQAEANQLAETGFSYGELKEKGYLITDQAQYDKYKKWGSFNPPEGYGSSGTTRTGKLNFSKPVAEDKGIDPLPDYKEPDPELQPDQEFPFIFGNIRSYEHEHCSTFSNFHLMKMKDKNRLWINHLDARNLGLKPGEPVKLESPWGSRQLTAKPTWSIKQGVLASEGGFGHLRGLEGDPKYPQFGGCNTAGIQRPNTTENIGGTPLLKYIKTRVSKIDHIIGIGLEDS